MRITQEYAYEFIGQLPQQLTKEQAYLAQSQFIEILVRDDLSVRLNWTQSPQTPYHIPKLTKSLFYDAQYRRKPKQVSSLMLWSNINSFLEYYSQTQAKQTIQSVRDFVIVVHSLSPIYTNIQGNQSFETRQNYLAYDTKGNELLIIDEGGDPYHITQRYALLNQQPVDLTPNLNYEINGLIRQMSQEPTLLQQALEDELNIYKGYDE